MRHLSLLQNHCTILFMGFSPRPWRDECGRRRYDQECGGRRARFRSQKHLEFETAECCESLCLVDCQGLCASDYLEGMLRIPHGKLIVHIGIQARGFYICSASDQTFLK